MTGAALGQLGGLLASDDRAALATLLAVAGTVLALGDIIGTRWAVPLQCDRETPQRWMDAGALKWAARNGIALGAGLGSRIGFAIWYVIPLAAMLSGEALYGAAIYGTYGFARGLGAPLILLAAARRGVQPTADWLLSTRPLARHLSGLVLLALSAGALLVAGT